MVFLSTLLTSVLLTVMIIPFLSRLALHYRLVDIPNERKIHSRPIPRVGGLAIAVGTFVPIVYWCWGEKFITAYLSGAVILVLFGFLDDYCDLAPRWKLLGQLVPALIVIYGADIRIIHLGMLASGGFLLPGWCSLPLTVLVIVGVTNAINLSDGMDGLAGGISLLGLSFISYLAYLEGNVTLALSALALSGAVFGFLRFNSFPATVFMGDAGSQLLGFSSITLALGLTQGNTDLSPILPLIVLGFPVLDTLTVMTGRILRGCSPFTADKTHFHHHCLLRLKLHQTESVMLIYTIQAALIFTAFKLRFYSDWLLLVVYLVFSGMVLTIVSLSSRHHWELSRLKPLEKLKLGMQYLRDRTSCIKYLFRILKFSMLALLFLTMLLTAGAPVYIHRGAAVAIAGLVAVSFFRPALLEEYLRVILYLLIPIGIYFSSLRIVNTAGILPDRLCNIIFVLLGLLSLLVSTLSHGEQGFKHTPLDFLILFLALVVPILLEPNLQNYHLGMIPARIIICYLCCEVVLTELRGKFRLVALGTFASLVLLAVQGL